MKKVLSLVLALSMMLSMAAISFATVPEISAKKFQFGDVSKALEGKDFQNVAAENQNAVGSVNVAGRTVTITISSDDMVEYDNDAGLEKWFAIKLDMDEPATTTLKDSGHTHVDCEPYEIAEADIGEQAHWKDTTENTAIIWLHASNVGFEKRVACFDGDKCITFEIDDRSTAVPKENLFHIQGQHIVGKENVAGVGVDPKYAANQDFAGLPLDEDIEEDMIHQGFIDIIVDPSQMVEYKNASGLTEKWFAVIIDMGEVMVPVEHEHANYQIDIANDMGYKEHWGEFTTDYWGTLPVTNEETIIFWLRASGDNFKKRITCFEGEEGTIRCLTFNITVEGEEEPVRRPSGGNNSGPSAAETAASDAKSETSSAVSSFSGIASDIAALTGGLPMADAGTATAAQLEALCKEAGIKTTTVEAGGKKSVVPMIAMDLGKMDGRLYYDVNDMLAGTGLYIEFKGSDGKLYMVPATALSKSAPNRIFFPESYLIALAINK